MCTTQPPTHHEQQQQQQAPRDACVNAGALAAAVPAADVGSTCSRIKTGLVSAGNGMAPAAAGGGDACGADAAAVGQPAGAGGVPSAARQLFGSLLPFGSGTANISQQDRPQSGSKAGANHTSSSVYACGAVTTLSGASTPTAAVAAGAGSILYSPRNLGGAGPGSAAAAGTNGLLVSTGAGSSHHSSHHHHRSSLTSTPTAAAAAAASASSGVGGTPSSGPLRPGQHHRTSSGTSDAASRTPAPAWPSSPPATGKCSYARTWRCMVALIEQRRGVRAVSCR